MDARTRVAAGPERQWDRLTARAVRAHFQGRLFSVVVWFGLCGMMLSALYGTERFLVQELSLGALITTSATLCALVIAFALRGGFAAIRLLNDRSRWAPTEWPRLAPIHESAHRGPANAKKESTLLL